jgi:hypothetical protein
MKFHDQGNNVGILKWLVMWHFEVGWLVPGKVFQNADYKSMH